MVVAVVGIYSVPYIMACATWTFAACKEFYAPVGDFDEPL